MVLATAYILARESVDGCHILQSFKKGGWPLPFLYHINLLEGDRQIVNRTSCSFCLLILSNWKKYLKAEKIVCFCFLIITSLFFEGGQLLNLQNQRIKDKKHSFLISIKHFMKQHSFQVIFEPSIQRKRDNSCITTLYTRLVVIHV